MSKNYFSIDEISELIKEKKHTIRFWEDRIEKLKVLRTNSGHRLYNYENLLILKKIKFLIKDNKLTLEGINQYFKTSHKSNYINETITTELKDLLNLLKTSNNR